MGQDMCTDPLFLDFRGFFEPLGHLVIGQADPIMAGLDLEVVGSMLEAALVGAHAAVRLAVVHAGAHLAVEVVEGVDLAEEEVRAAVVLADVGKLSSLF